MAELLSALTAIGLEEVEIRESFDCFAGTSKEKVARKYGVRGVNVFGRKKQ